MPHQLRTRAWMAPALCGMVVVFCRGGAAAPKPAGPALHGPRHPGGDGSVAVSGERKQWHKVTLTVDGP